MNPLNDDGTFGPDEFIELDNPELEDEDLRTYITHAVSLMERPLQDTPTSLFGKIANPSHARYTTPLERERLEIVIDYLYAELARRLNVQPT